MQNSVGVTPQGWALEISPEKSWSKALFFSKQEVQKSTRGWRNKGEGQLGRDVQLGSLPPTGRGLPRPQAVRPRDMGVSTYDPNPTCVEAGNVPLAIALVPAPLSDSEGPAPLTSHSWWCCKPQPQSPVQCSFICHWPLVPLNGHVMLTIGVSWWQCNAVGRTGVSAQLGRDFSFLLSMKEHTWSPEDPDKAVMTPRICHGSCKGKQPHFCFPINKCCTHSTKPNFQNYNSRYMSK